MDTLCQEEKDPLTERDYRKGKIGLALNHALHSMGSQFVSVTYLSAMMLLLGITPSQIALVVSAGSFAGLAMGLAPYLYPYIKHPKLFLWIGILIQTIPMAFLFTFPALGFGAKTFVIIGAEYLLSCIIGNVISPMYSEIQQTYAEHGGRIGAFYSWNAAAVNGMSFLALLIITLLTGRLEEENPSLLYLLFGILGFLCFVGRLTFVAVLIREPKMTKMKSPGNILHGLLDMFSCKQFRPYLFYAMCVVSGGAMISGIQTVFFVQKMGLSLQFLALLDSIALLGRMIVSPLLGKLNSHLNTRKCLAYSLILCSVCYLFHVIMTPENAVAMRIIQQIIGVVSFAGTGIFASPFQFQCMPKEKHISYISFIQVAASAVGFLIGLLVSGIVQWTEGMSVALGGFEFTEMHFLHLGCAVMYMIPAVYLLTPDKKRIS